MSKVGEFALTMIQQRLLDKQGNSILVNGCCPGYVDTDMTSHKGPLTPAQGAETPVYLAMLPSHATQPKGQFVFQKKVIDWMTGNAI
ncbi:unnamed protein product [Soboliphyme baturini]|uniref:C-factor n=1 Tax=Soboliphyme baturini TaxID=241478 RepID=A0A183J9C9_9BILA|nr:unnamed protein product [Soboliphyme baturini]